jgi:hypothetical protein
MIFETRRIGYWAMRWMSPGREHKASLGLRLLSWLGSWRLGVFWNASRPAEGSAGRLG